MFRFISLSSLKVENKPHSLIYNNSSQLPAHILLMNSMPGESKEPEEVLSTKWVLNTSAEINKTQRSLLSVHLHQQILQVLESWLLLKT